MSFQIDYVFTDARGEQQNWNHNLTYNEDTGRSNPYNDLSMRRYVNWGVTSRAFSVGQSDYKALETGWTKRFSNNWQASATYTFASFSDCDGDPVFGAFRIDGDLGGECSMGQGDQTHRMVFNGIWQAPGGVQLSGLFFYGSGDRKGMTFGSDLAIGGSGGKSSRLLPDAMGTIPCTRGTCSLVERNGFVGDPINRTDIKISRPILFGRFDIEPSFEIFNLMNNKNFYAYTTALGSASFGNPRQSTLSAYVPRTAAIGLSVGF
jgi:hypothetical protein